MTKRVASLVLAIAMLLQILVPQTLIAKEEVKAPSDNLVKEGMISGDSYDSKLMLELNRLTAKNRRKRSADPGTSLFGYFEDGQEPKDKDKPKYYGEVKAILNVVGIDGGTFPWNDIFGTDEKGNPKAAHLRFIQMNDGVETGIERVLEVTESGNYLWTDGDDNPAELPLFNYKLEPLTYEVKLDEEVSDKVKLLTARLTKTEDADTPTFEPPDAEGRIKYHINLVLGLQQVASSKFVSEWHTGVAESDRPQVQGSMTASMDTGKSKTINFNLPTNDNVEVIVRTNSRRDKNKFIPEFLFKTPTTVELKTDTAGLTFEETNGVKTVTSGDHKFKYEFTYDVLNGGKLVMTEIIPLTFDANGGEFANFTAPDTKTQIIKEVEYGKDLDKLPDNPRRDRYGFKGWGIKKAQDKLVAVTSEAFKNIKKPTTFYAIWKKNKVSADRLEVKESYKEGTEYVNDFIPTFDQLRGQVKIRDASGIPQALKDTDKLEILDDSGNAIPETDLKDKLYEKLKEDPSTEVSREVRIEARVTRADGTPQHVTIMVNVFKNIYEAKTESNPPYYVPNGYVKVTVDPTTKAEKPQKYFYYVNPDAKVAIEKENPVGVGANTFVKWANGDKVYKLDGKERNQFKDATTIRAEYTTDVIPQTGTEKPDTVPANFVEVKFVPTDKATNETKAEKVFWVNPEKEVTIPVDNPVGKDTNTFKEWKIGVNADGDVYTVGTAKKFTDVNGTTITATYVDDVLPADASGNKPSEAPTDYVKVTVKKTDKAKLSTDPVEKEEQIFYVNPNKKVKLPVTKPEGKDVAVGEDNNNTKAFKWKFTEWKSDENGPRTWKENVVAAGIEDKFPVETTITAQYEKVITDQGSVTADEITTHESFKDGDAWVNNFIDSEASEAKLKAALKVNGGELPNDATVTFLLDKDSSGTQYASLEAELYDKLQEKANTNNEPTRVEKVKAQVKFANGEVQTVDIPIKVYKNIYEAKTESNPPYYVPDEYVKVTVDPTTKATEPQKTYYYVNPAAKVVIPGEDPTGIDGNTFTKWLIDGTDTEYKLKDKPRHKFEKETIIKAQYSKDVIPQEGDTKPEGTPDNFKKVTFDPTDNGTMEGAKIFWVNPEKEVTIPVKDPVGKTYYTFNGWKIGDVTTGKTYNPSTPKKFEQDTTITATYTESDNIIPFNPSDLDNPNNPIKRPEGYVKVTFDAEAGIKLTEQKAYYVKKNAKDTEGKPITLGSAALKKPAYDVASGYAFNGWNKPDTTEIKEDIVVTAKARKTYSECTPDYRPDDNYETRYKYRDRIVEKEKIVEKIVKVGSDDMLKEIRYMQGFEGKFRPYDGLRRCEAAQILANALKADGYRYNEHYALSYTDVGNEWYTDAIRVVTQAGVFAGYNDGTFKPNGKITRAEWISTLRRFQNLRVEAGNLMNLKPGHWASGEVGAALMAGWLEIYVNGTVKFDADAPITRQEVAAVSNKAFRRVLDKVYLRRSVNTLLNYKDINPSMPLYEDILCASNTLLTDGRYYKANTIVMDNVTFNIVTDLLKITQKKFQILH